MKYKIDEYPMEAFKKREKKYFFANGNLLRGIRFFDLFVFVSLYYSKVIEPILFSLAKFLCLSRECFVENTICSFNLEPV